MCVGNVILVRELDVEVLDSLLEYLIVLDVRVFAHIVRAESINNTFVSAVGERCSLCATSVIWNFFIHPLVVVFVFVGATLSPLALA